MYLTELVAVIAEGARDCSNAKRVTYETINIDERPEGGAQSDGTKAAVARTEIFIGDTMCAGCDDMLRLLCSCGWTP